jgi:hydroxymethylpyrimidine/phosphomethylpyrimidine kinase
MRRILPCRPYRGQCGSAPIRSLIPVQVPRRSPPIVLTLAGSDPTSGAGLQADALTLAALGCHPLSVVTAITVQDTVGVTSVHAIAAHRLVEQARAVLDDMRVAAIKVGMVGTAENAAAIAQLAADHPDVPLVVDPVLASGRGDSLADAATIVALREQLIPRATVVTPNSIEARRLAFPDADAAARSLDEAAARLVMLGARFVLVTGTHEDTPDVVNTLYGAGGVVASDRWERLAGDYHGSGCTLASAIAGFLALGRAAPEAVREAQRYAWQTLAHAFRPGRGQLIPDRFFAHRKTALD